MDWLEKFLKEWDVIKAVPRSFIIVCAVVIGASWTGFHFTYKGKLDDAHDETTHWKTTADNWQSETQYYKELTSHQTQHEVFAARSAASKSQAPKPSRPEKTKEQPKDVRAPSTTDSQTSPPPSVSAPNGIAIGRDNNGTAIVNNGAVPRNLTQTQASLIVAQLGAQPKGFQGSDCLLGDQEGCAFAEQIRKAFSQGGWIMAPSMAGQDMFVEHREGLYLMLSPDDLPTTPPEGVIHLFNVLRQAGLNFVPMAVPDIQKGTFQLLVAANTRPS